MLLLKIHSHVWTEFREVHISDVPRSRVSDAVSIPRSVFHPRPNISLLLNQFINPVIRSPVSLSLFGRKNSPGRRTVVPYTSSAALQ